LKEFKFEAMRNKQLLFTLLILLFSALRAEAATYTVKAAGGGNYSTISACAAVAVAGDNCVIYAGTYNETVSPAHSGSSGSPITFSTNPGDSVTVTGWNLGSLSYITITGSSAAPMIVTQAVTWSAITHSIFQYISNTAGAGGSCFGGNGWYQSGQPSSYNQFLNLTLQYCGGKSNNSSGAIELEGHYNLFDTINVSYSQAGVTLSGQYNVIRNSTFGPTSLAVIGSNHSQPVENSVACGGGSGADIPGGMQHLLYENNYSAQWRGGNSHGTALITDTGSTVCGTTSNVFRLSQTMDSGSYSTEIYSSLNTYFYNDSFSDTQLDAGTKDQEDYQFDPSAPNSRTINNIFANMTQAGATDWCIYADTPLVENHNLCFNTGSSGSWNGPSTGSGSSYDASDIFNKDPLFVNADTNLQLQSGSPASGAGGPLTTAVGSGAVSTSLTVADAGFFSWGYGIPNVQPDWIRIGASTTVQISSINYSTNVITLASPVTWSSGAGVYLYKSSNGAIVLNGANPDIGAFPFGSASGSSGSQAPPVPPTNVQATAK
jgi:hypothetical protein